MEINENLFEGLLKKVEQISEQSAILNNEQSLLIGQLQQSFLKSNEILASQLLSIAAEIGKNGFRDKATLMEEKIVNTLLTNAPYDAKQAFYTHKTMFAERHEMAMFIRNNIERIRENVRNRPNFSSENSTGKIKVFTYWDSEDNLPDIVSLCRDSLKKYINPEHFELVILNKESYKNWVDFRQEHIQAKISQAHFTDLLRMKLLERWGGFWLDATCLLTEDFYTATKEIREQKQFFFAYTKSRTGTWFIYSNPNNYIISMVSEAIQLWWKEKAFLTNYFMVHDVIEMLYWVDEKYHDEWKKMKAYHPREALHILRSYNQKTSKDAFIEMQAGSFVHKLTYKYDQNKVGRESVLEYLLGCLK